MQSMEKPEQTKHMEPKTQTYFVTADTIREAIEAVHCHDVPKLGEARDGFVLVKKTGRSTSCPRVWEVACEFKSINDLPTVRYFQ